MLGQLTLHHLRAILVGDLPNHQDLSATLIGRGGADRISFRNKDYVFRPGGDQRRDAL